MISEFRFQLQNNLLYGVGYSRKLPDFLQEKAFHNAVVLVDEGVAKYSPYYAEIIDLLKKATKSLHIEQLRGNEEPDYDYLDKVAEKIRAAHETDVIIGIGGGSCIDITKAVAVLKTNPGKGVEYRGFHMVKKPGVPTIAIPTTAGTGSEVTINAVFTDKKEMKKLGINGRYLNATHAVLDAEWTMSCPRSVAVSSGMDALTHALESFMTNNANPLTRALSKEAFRLLYHVLPFLIDDPENRKKRQELLLGSYLAGAALFNSGSGIAGALSYPIGVHYKVPHGIGGGIFLASVVEFNVNKGYEDYSELYDLIESNSTQSIQEKNKRFTKAIYNLSRKLEVPPYLDAWGITADNVEEAANLMLPLQAAFNQNPVPFSAESDARDILRKHVKPL